MKSLKLKILSALTLGTISLFDGVANAIGHFGVGRGTPNAAWIMISPNHPILGWALVVIGLVPVVLYFWFSRR